MKTKLILLLIAVLFTINRTYGQKLGDFLNTVIKTGIYVDTDSKSNNTLSRLTGTWTKYQILYPNGRRDWIPYNQQIKISIFPDFDKSSSLMGYKYYLPGESSPNEEGVVWFGYGGTLCMGSEYNRFASGLQFKFGTDDRGMECLMIKALLLSNENVWLIYRRDI